MIEPHVYTRPVIPPTVLRGFEHIRRHWDSRAGRWAAKVLPGEYYVTCKDEVITTVLGSCIAACVRDPVAGVGGMNHFMLPVGEADDDGLATRYGSFAMECLINELLKRGAERGRLEIKLFGGGQILGAAARIGKLNIEFAHRYLATDRLKVVAEDLGGAHPRRVAYFPVSGQAFIRRLRTPEQQALAERERTYLAQVHATVTGTDGGVELFD
jgi:chemotaxis protein CheD